MKREYQIKLYDALKRITSYSSLEALRRGARTQYGLVYEEALEMSYENVLEEARSAVRGLRRPVERAKRPAKPEPALKKEAEGEGQ